MTGNGIETVAIVGAGMMGTGLAAEYAATGHTVTLFARTESSAVRAKERTYTALDSLAAAGVLGADEMPAARDRVRASTDLSDAVAGADLVVESIPENLVLKREMFVTLETICPATTILASNTSGIPITQIAARMRHPERFIGTHYLNPPHLMPPVEVIPGEQTDPAIVARVRDNLAAMGKSPVVVGKEAPGFLWNRLQYAILREACHIVEQGIATKEEVDMVMRQGLARRWSIVGGPFASLDLGGIGTSALVGAYLFPALSGATDVPPTLAEPVAAGRTGAESGAGFYDWPPERLKQTLDHRNAKLVAALREDRDGSGAPAQ
ncbi:MAG: 3-hydroxyacyl-CoA dehydrogenase family protein [Chloroflexota bacterium]|nr:3-hydroxyacyl-CoA dehydrogenase family protein [Chloroflexota bacterium]